MRIPLAGLLLAAILVPAGLAPPLVSGHPPSADVHNGCLRATGAWSNATASLPSNGTLSYLMPLGTSMSCSTSMGDSDEWASEAAPCPPLPFVGPVPGAYCGPAVLPFGTATCDWISYTTWLKTQLVVGFDANTGSLAIPNGAASFTADGERRVFGPFQDGEWVVSNPHPTVARVIGFPTNVDPGLAGQTFPGTYNELECVTP